MKINSDIEVKNLLPLGTVVTIDGLEHKLMIVEYFVKNKNSDKSFDYLAVLWPEGDITSETKFMFNAKDIDTIYFYGFVNSESLEFLEDLNNELNKE